VASNNNEPTSPPPRAYAKAYAGMAEANQTAAISDTKVLWRIIQITFRYKWSVIIAVIATFIAAGFQLAVPSLVGNAVDSALGLLGAQTVSSEDAQRALLHAAFLLLGVSVLRGIFTLIHNFNGEAIGHKLAYDLRQEFYNKLQVLSSSFHDQIHTGELITRGMLDLEGVRMFINTGLLRILLLLALICAGAWILISTDLVLGLLSLSFVPFVAWRSASARLKLRFLWFSFQDQMAVLGRIMDENLTGIKVVRAFGGEKHELAKYDSAADEAMDLSSARIKARVSSTTQMTFAYYLAMGLVLWVGGSRVIAGTITVGTLTEFLTFITILQLPVRQLGLVVNSVARASTCGGRLFAVLDIEPEISEKNHATPLSIKDRNVRFENVSFAYDSNDDTDTSFDARRPPALNDISFEVGRGKTLGIVGPPGSGKSTIAHLLIRHYDVIAGRITIDGQDIRTTTLDSLRSAVRVISQDPFLFTASLENNIAYGNPWVEEGEIRGSAAIAQIDGFIDGLNEGYQTLVGERGVSLSGGQKQRTAIARTAILAPAVLILDDSMAAIDAATENRIRQGFAPVMANAATIIISHRLSALYECDEIIVLEAGHIVERGSHSNLIFQQGRYAKLFSLQNKNSTEPERDRNQAAQGELE